MCTSSNVSMNSIYKVCWCIEAAKACFCGFSAFAKKLGIVVSLAFGLSSASVYAAETTLTLPMAEVQPDIKAIDISLEKQVETSDKVNLINALSKVDLVNTATTDTVEEAVVSNSVSLNSLEQAPVVAPVQQEIPAIAKLEADYLPNGVESTVLLNANTQTPNNLSEEVAGLPYAFVLTILALISLVPVARRR